MQETGGNGVALSRLAESLIEHPTTRFMMAMDKRFRGTHLKDLVATEMDDQRRMTVCGKTIYNFGSDSFLGLDRDARVQQALVDGVRRWGTHNGASRVFYSVEANDIAEKKLAKWLGVEATLIFPTVTLANMGLLPGLAGAGDVLAVDLLAHNSIHEGAKIAHDNGADLRTFDPCTADVLASTLAVNKPQRGCIVAVDGVYSMQGTTPPLRAIKNVTDEFGGVMYIDDAHGTGIFGPQGRGTAMRELGDIRDVIVVGSLSKAFSCMGAFVTCTEELKPLLKVSSPTYVFGGPVAPPYLEAVCTVCDILDSTEYAAIIGRLRTRIARLIEGLHTADLVVLGGESPIVSVLVKDRAAAMQAGKWLFDHGFYVQSVTYPAVPMNGAVLRIQVNANHPLPAIDGLVKAFAAMREEIRLPRASEQKQYA